MVGISATSLQYQALLLQCFCLMSNQVAKLVRVQLKKKKKRQVDALKPLFFCFFFFKILKKLKFFFFFN
jgi:hypothetical protein